MRKYLLPKEGNFYKANLHCHTTLSDGDFTPEEIKEMYKAHGYSVVAYTDHDILVPHPDLNDENFLALNGMEVEINETAGEWRYIKTCHMCFIALDKDNLVQPCYHRSKYLMRNAVKYRDKIIFDETQPDFEREHTAECINKMIKTARDQGFFVTYNHPTWSMETFEDYIALENLNAMEIFNTGCQVVGYEEYNEKEYEDMVRAGKRIYCVSADDTHHEQDCFGGYVMIKAPNLEYKSITEALQKGNFYASQGPEIKELYLEDGTLHIECSDAVKIVLQTDNRYMLQALAPKGGCINCADFEIDDKNKYFRITVTDADGNHANTNAYFMDEL